MAYKMTKQGSLDNQVTNEFFCDTTADLEAIPTSKINLGSIAVVVDPFEVFIANSSKTWVSLTPTSEEEESES